MACATRGAFLHQSSSGWGVPRPPGRKLRPGGRGHAHQARRKPSQERVAREPLGAVGRTDWRREVQTQQPDLKRGVPWGQAWHLPEPHLRAEVTRGDPLEWWSALLNGEVQSSLDHQWASGGGLQAQVSLSHSSQGPRWPAPQPDLSLSPVAPAPAEPTQTSCGSSLSGDLASVLSCCPGRGDSRRGLQNLRGPGSARAGCVSVAGTASPCLPRGLREASTRSWMTKEKGARASGLGLFSSKLITLLLLSSVLHF